MKIKRWCSFYEGRTAPLIEKSLLCSMSFTWRVLCYHSLATTLTSTVCFSVPVSFSVFWPLRTVEGDRDEQRDY